MAIRNITFNLLLIQMIRYIRFRGLRKIEFTNIKKKYNL
jgi:hypothetical protein